MVTSAGSCALQSKGGALILRRQLPDLAGHLQKAPVFLRRGHPGKAVLQSRQHIDIPVFPAQQIPPRPPLPAPSPSSFPPRRKRRAACTVGPVYHHPFTFTIARRFTVERCVNKSAGLFDGPLSIIYSCLFFMKGVERRCSTSAFTIFPPVPRCCRCQYCRRRSDLCSTGTGRACQSWR